MNKQKEDGINSNNIEKSVKDYFTLNNDVYIYGAGKYADYVYVYCREEGVNVKGFITSHYEKDNYHGLKVYTIDELEELQFLNIVPGFLGCSNSIIKNLRCNCNYLDVNVDFFKYYFVKIAVSRLMTELHFKKRMSSKKTWDNILVIRMDAIGDLMCTTPYIRELKRNFKKSNVMVLCQRSNSTILKNNPYIDKLWCFDGRAYNSDIFTEEEKISELIEVVRRLVSEINLENRVDAVFLPMALLNGRNSLFSLALAMAFNPDNIVGYVIGDEYGLGCYYVAKSAVSSIHIIREPLHETEYLLETLRREGLKVESNLMDIYPDNRDLINNYIAENLCYKKKIVVGVVGSAVSRNWSPEKYNSLFKICERKKYCFILLGGEDAVASAQKIEQRENVVNLTGQLKLEETISVIAGADLYLGSNTGLLHIASALKVPTVTLYAFIKGGSPYDGDSPTRYGDRNEKHIDLLPQKGLDGCEGHCRKPYSHCINQITVEEVQNAIKELLGE